MLKRFLEWIGLKEKLHTADNKPPLFKEGEIWWSAIGENVGIEVNGKGKPFSRPVYIYKKLKPLLDDPGFVRIYTKSLRVMDLLNGCCRQCKFCYIDAGIPTKMISSESFIKLFSDSRFKQLLMDDSLRIGNSGDIADHPEAVKIVSFLLKEFPQKKLRILSNYRHRDKDKIMELVNLARVYNKDSNIPFNLRRVIKSEISVAGF